MTLKNEPILYYALIDYFKIMNIYLNHAPKHEKYALCQEIRKNSYLMQEYVTEVLKKYHKKTSLTNLDLTHNKVKTLFKIYYDLGYFEYKNNSKSLKSDEALRKYNNIMQHLDKIGRIIGGWIKTEIND